MEHEVSSTVIYTVRITDFNAGAWYKGEKNNSFEVLLTVVDRQFSSPEIMFQVLGAFKPVKYIKQHHCRIIDQRIGTHNELSRYYAK